MYDNEAFQHLVEQGSATGEVVGVDRFLVTVKGLETVAVNALVLFENGASGIVREVGTDHVLILNLAAETIPLGTLVVLQSSSLTVGVGPELIGRIVSPLGEPLDGKGPIKLSQQGEVFAEAPGIMERSLLKDQLVTGVTIVDSMFPIVLGQRIAILGDNKSGKSTFMIQMGLTQSSNQDRVVIHVLIAKRQADIDNLVAQLEASGAIKSAIVVVASIFDSLAKSYLAPYTACAMGEYLWHHDHDVIMVYDDLSNHAKIYRELSLLSRVNPGRDSYPGDMFYAHSSLLERAGKLQEGGRTMTALPVVLTPNDDITAYLPTGIMSITDGQIIFDLESFRKGIRPAVNIGLSVSRVGGRAQTLRAKELTGSLLKLIAEYRQAAQFARFGSELALDSQANLELGKRVYEGFLQGPSDIYSLTEQYLILATILRTKGKSTINVDSLKKQVRAVGPSVTNEEQYDDTITKLLTDNTIQSGGTKSA